MTEWKRNKEIEREQIEERDSTCSQEIITMSLDWNDWIEMEEEEEEEERKRKDRLIDRIGKSVTKEVKQNESGGK